MQDPNHELLAYVADLAALGAPFPDGLRAAAEEFSFRRNRKALTTLADRLERGESLESAILTGDWPTDEFVTTAIRSGLATRDLSSTLLRLSEFESKQQALRRSFWISLSYPLCLVGLSGLIIYLLSQIPVADIIRNLEMSADLSIKPFLDHLIQALGIGLVGLVALFLSLRFGLGAAKTRWLIGELPFIGPILKANAAWEFSTRLRILLSGGSQMEKSLSVLSTEARDANLRELCHRLTIGVRNGKSLGQQLQGTTRVPATLTCLIAWGETHDALEDALQVASEIFERRLQMRHHTIKIIMPPLIYLVVGAIAVGGVFSMFVPLINLLRWF